jgi:hypothetical protein
MRPLIWFGGLAIAIACSVTSPTPEGTVVASFDASQSKWPDLAAAAPKASGIAEGTFDAAGRRGASVTARYKTGSVVIGQKTLRVPLEATVTVTDSAGFAISGHFSDGPTHFAGMPDDLRALDFTAQLSQGTRSCKGTSYTNDWLRLRIHGDGRAELLPEPVAAGSVAPPVLSR